MLDGTSELLLEILEAERENGPRHRCEVVEGGEERARIRFVESVPEIEVGSIGRIYIPRERDRSFSCRAVRVFEVSSDGRECLVLMHGPSESTPAREFYRVHVDDGVLVCTLRDESCSVASISAGGMGLTSAQCLAVDDTLEIVLHDGAQAIAGRVRVASARALPDERFFYGVELAPGVGDAAPELAGALARICVRLQLAELRRFRSD